MAFLLAMAALGLGLFLLLGLAVLFDIARAALDRSESASCWIPERHPWHPGCWQARPDPEETSDDRTS